MLSDLLLVIIGLCAGVFGTIIGAGGGFLIVPYLLLAKNFSSQMAVGTSLVVVFFNALSGTYAYAKQKRIDYGTAWSFALATVPGSVLGAWVAQWLSGEAFRKLFGLFILSVSLYVWRRARNNQAQPVTPGESPRADAHKEVRQITDAEGNTYHVSYDRKWGIITSFGVGLLASVLGIGGGLIHVPLMIYLLSFPAHLATATSHLILTISSAIAAISHMYVGEVDIRAAFYLAMGAIIGAQVGANVAKRVKGTAIIQGLVIALIFLGLRLLFG